ncbi:glycosyltransferase family 64 protein C4 [Prunus yedoensis var. nudiflora]|uniref:Glycosyltransferase family 64 protein C4 n=1 Tax=Prunus yedoensis var. nudiflora TaxID=2094558 RepID=A0A314XSD1_PRUYE|nr:glycosyltransferase family 64 protein C4 [Prunus yedoensis var. nudiflora]
MFGKVHQIQWLDSCLACTGLIRSKVIRITTLWRMVVSLVDRSIREFITKNRNCEDIAMSFLVANATSAPPIWVKGKIFEIGSTGISSLGGHSEKRTHCIDRFVAEFGRMPLVPTSVKAVDSRNIWFW